MSDHNILVIWLINTFLVWFCVFLPPLLNLFWFCYILLISIVYHAHLTWSVPLISPIFLKRSLVFPVLLFSSTSLHCSFKKVFLSLLAILWNSAFSWVYFSLSPLLLFFPQPFVKPLQSLCLLAFLFLWDSFGHRLLYNVTNNFCFSFQVPVGYKYVSHCIVKRK